MKRAGHLLRWVAVLPGALLAGLIAAFPLHWMLYSTLTNFVDPYPELPERILTPLAFGLAFVWGGSRIAPKNRMKTALVLFGIWMVPLGGFVFLALSGGTWMGQTLNLQGGGLAALMSGLGGGVGLYIARRQSRHLEQWLEASRRDETFDHARLAHHREKVSPDRYEALLAHYGSGPTIFEPIRAKVTEADIRSMFASVAAHAGFSDDDRFVTDMALMEVLDGVMPSAEGLNKLEAVFGAEFAEAIRAKSTVHEASQS